MSRVLKSICSLGELDRAILVSLGLSSESANIVMDYIEELRDSTKNSKTVPAHLYFKLRHRYDWLQERLDESKKREIKMLKSKVNGELYKLEFESNEPNERIEVRHLATGKLFQWEHMSTFEQV